MNIWLEEVKNVGIEIPNLKVSWNTKKKQIHTLGSIPYHLWQKLKNPFCAIPWSKSILQKKKKKKEKKK